MKDVCPDQLEQLHVAEGNAADLPNIPSMEFERHFRSLKKVAMYSLVQKSRGATLQKIAEDCKITRERVRQIIEKSSHSLMAYAELIAQVIGQDTFSSSDILAVFDQEDVAQSCLFVLKESQYYSYCKLFDKFVGVNCCPEYMDRQLGLFTEEIIGSGLNFQDHIEQIEASLPNYQLGFLDCEDIMTYLVQSGYHFYGDYVVKGKAPYAIVCHDAISKYFMFDIKLDADEANEDIKKLRRIIQKQYHGLTLPTNNRALTAALARHKDIMILSGRGRYCPIEKVIYTPTLLEEIRNDMLESTQTSFYYNEIFAKYKARLLPETNISNSNFLHGMLVYLYPDEFSYERDLLVKTGEIRLDINERLCALMREKGSPMTKAELTKAIPGLNHFVIAMSVARVPQLIQWEYNSFNHVNNLSYTDEDIKCFQMLVEGEIHTHHGYMSEAMLYDAAKKTCIPFMEKNHIKNALNLYFVVAYLLQDDYRFRRPHILSKDFPVEDLSVVRIAKELLHCEETLNYSAYTDLALRVGWAPGTQYAVFTEMERDFVRIDENNYVRRDLFHMDEYTLQSISTKICSLVEHSGYYALNEIASYADFPRCTYEWNIFLLVSVIEEYQMGFKIISPQVRSRRYLRGIIVPESSPIDSFEMLVLDCLKREGIQSLSEEELLYELQTRGLVGHIMPRELYQCERMPYVKGMFCIA
ncbi:MAG: hypothetical protein RR053_01765 [Evtepia sp.]